MSEGLARLCRPAFELHTDGLFSLSTTTIDRTYGHLAEDSEDAIRARLEARGGRSGVEVASAEGG